MLQAGALLQGRYRIEDVLGEGGMGVVYLARQVRLADRAVAIKELTLKGAEPEERDRYVRQFEREAKILASLSHPGLVDVKDFFEEDDRMFLVMDLVEGANLAQVITEPADKAGVDLILDWALQLVGVLEYLHHHDPPVVVRDLKPGNIMLEPNGHIRLIDFGIAREYVPSQQTTTSIKGTGTPGYAPPEQYGAKTDQRSDIYSLGATLYALVAARVPPISVLRMSGEEMLIPLSTVNTHVCKAVSEVIGKMLELNREDRPQTIDEVRTALTRAAAVQKDSTSDGRPLAAEPTRTDLFSSREAAESGLIAPLLDPTCARCGFRLDTMNSVCPRCGAGSYFEKQSRGVAGSEPRPSYWNSVLPPVSTGDPVAPPEPVPEQAPPRRPMWVQVAVALLLAGALTLGVVLVRWGMDRRLPRPLPMASGSASQVARGKTTWTDPDHLFKIAVPSGWRYGPHDTSPGGNLPDYTRLVMVSPSARDYCVVEVFSNCSSSASALTVIQSFLQARGQAPVLTPLGPSSPDTFDVQIEGVGQTIHGRSYFSIHGDRTWRLTQMHVGGSFPTSDATLAAIVQSYEASP